MGRRVLRRVLRRRSKKGLSRRHLEGRNTPFREYDPLGVCPLLDLFKTYFAYLVASMDPIIPRTRILTKSNDCQIISNVCPGNFVLPKATPEVRILCVLAVFEFLFQLPSTQKRLQMKIWGFVFAFTFVMEIQINSPRFCFAFAFVTIMLGTRKPQQQAMLTK